MYFIYASRLLIGIGIGGAAISISVFIAEISSDKYKISTLQMIVCAYFIFSLIFSTKGALNAVFFTSLAIGHTIGVLVATLLQDYRKNVIYSMIVPTLFVVGFSFLPETPAFLLKKNKFEVFRNYSS